MPHSKPILIGIVYRPPHDSQFLKIFQSTIDNAKELADQETYIMGDMNINMDKSNLNNASIVNEYNVFCRTQNFLQLIKSPTHISKISSSIIDHILTNLQDRVSQSGVIETTFSDHFSIFCTRKITRNRPNKHKTIKIRSLRNYSRESYLEKLKDIKLPAMDENSNIDEIYANFATQLRIIIDTVAPLREIRVKNNTPDWFDGEILEEIRKRDKLHKKYKNYKLEEDGVQYRSSRNKVQTLINTKKQKYIQNSLEENKRNSKKLWKNLKNLGLPSKIKSNSKINLNIDGKLNSNDADIADHFNSFFSTLAAKLVEKLPAASNRFGEKETANHYKGKNLQNNNFKFQEVDQTNISKILQNFNESKSPGFDNIPGRFLKDGGEFLNKIIADIFNLSILLKKFPNECKKAKIKPIFKKGSKLEAVNYRPISLLPLISKVFEKCIHDQLQHYLTEFDFIYKLQSGFRSDFLTDT